MTDEDRPPEEIWLNGEAIAKHFDSVKARYRAGASSDGMEPIEEGDALENEYTRDLRESLRKKR